MRQESANVTTEKALVLPIIYQNYNLLMDLKYLKVQNLKHFNLFNVITALSNECILNGLANSEQFNAETVAQLCI